MIAIRPVVFYIVQAAACVYAARRGGKPERLTASAMAIAAVATTLLPDDPALTFQRPEWGELLIDAALFTALFLLACRAARFWPLWAVALQVNAIAIHVIEIFDGAIVPAAYSIAVGWMAYPMIALLTIGTRCHDRRTRHGIAEDWSPLKW